MSPPPGHRWQRLPLPSSSVARPGSGPPAAPRSPPSGGDSPSKPPPASPSVPRPPRDGKGSFIPRLSRPPRGRQGSPRKIRRSYRTDSASSAAHPVPAGLDPRRAPRVPPVPLLALPVTARLKLALVLARPAPDPVQLVRRESVLQTLAAYQAGGADRLRPGYLAGPRPVRRDREEQFWIRLPAGGRPPPVVLFFHRLKRRALSRQPGNKNHT